jgi:predicted Zn-dependent protease
LEEAARRRSIEANPENALNMSAVERAVPGARRGSRRLALVVGRRWPASKTVLSVQFIDTPAKDLRSRILAHMNAWNKTANIRFEETAGTGEIRIARLSQPPDLAGYWSWVGTEVLAIPEDQPTMNLQGFTMKTAESEFRRVVRHETGHTLGFDHEHMRSDLVSRIDRKKAIAYFARTQHWTPKDVDAQVLTPLKEKSIMGTTESDPLSIMCYQIPAEITKDGKDIPGGKDINENDYAFASRVYPKLPGPTKSVTGDTNPAHDVTKVGSASSDKDSGPIRLVEGDGDTLSIFVMEPLETEPSNESTRRDRRPKFAQLFASYSGAQVVTTLRLSGGEGNPTAWGRIIAAHERIKKYTNREEGELPDEHELRQLGRDLFDTLMHGDVLRLYDEARTRQQNRKLDVVLTSMIPWVAEKPWEFAYDSKRRSFLATEDVNLVRNVVTAIPSYITAPRTGPLRILVVAAQPVGLGVLSVEQETEVIRRGFEPLEAAGQAVVEVLPRATPGRLHGKLSTADFDVVHFIGHGAFDEDLQEGALYFEDDRGNQAPMGVRSMREVFCKRGVNLLFINACQSGSGARRF